MTNQKQQPEQGAMQNTMSKDTDLLFGVLAVIKEMRVQIEWSRSLGDKWEADFLEGYCKQLEALVK